MSFTADGVQGVMGDSGGSDPNPRGHVSQASGGGEVYMRGKNGWSELCEGQREESSRQEIPAFPKSLWMLTKGDLNFWKGLS